MIKPVMIKITKSLSGMKFPYGVLPQENLTFISENVGKVLKAEQYGMNYYRLMNGMFVHVYNATEIPG